MRRSVGSPTETGISTFSVYRVDAELARTLAPDVILTQTQCEVCAVTPSDLEAAACDWLAGREGPAPRLVAVAPNTLGDVLDDLVRIADGCGVPERGAVSSADLAPVASACGSGAEQLRSCLRRLVAEGLLERAAAGRAVRYAATAAGLAALARQRGRMRRAYALDRGVPPWDGAWHLVGFAIPEVERAARDALQQVERPDDLRDAGGPQPPRAHL